MDSDTDNQRSFEELKKLRSQTRKNIKYGDIWSIAHSLAEDQFIPAIDYFVDGLNDSNWNWREDCIAFLGFHYRNLDIEIVNKFRDMLLHDQESSVRITAARALGAHSRLPDQALLIAYEDDPNLYVRQTAYESILILAGLKHSLARKHGKSFGKGDIQPKIDLIKQVLVKEGINIPHEFLTKI